MSWEIVFVLFLLLAALVSFILERVPTDVTAITVFALITLVSIFSGSERLPGLDEILGVFANPAPLTIAAMFVVSAALGKCHLIEAASGYLTRLVGIGYRGFLLVLIASVALISAFVNNTPVVVVFLPVVMSLAKSMNISSSKLLIPLSYASIFGGCCTLVGTSTNILASGIMGKNEIYPEMEPLGMFELAKVGLPLFFVAAGYLVLFGRRLLPDREALASILSDIQQKEFLTEAIVLSDSSLDGKTVDESGLSDLKRMRLLDVCREGRVLTGDKGKLVLRSGDRLILSCKPSGIVESRNIDGLDLLSETTLGLEQVSSASGVMVEGVIGPASPLISLSISEIDFRKRHNVAVIAIHRKGRNLTQEIDSIRLRSTDTLLLLGSEESIENIRSRRGLDTARPPPRTSERHESKSTCGNWCDCWSSRFFGVWRYAHCGIRYHRRGHSFFNWVHKTQGWIRFRRVEHTRSYLWNAHPRIGDEILRRIKFDCRGSIVGSFCVCARGVATVPSIICNLPYNCCSHRNPFQ